MVITGHPTIESAGLLLLSKRVNRAFECHVPPHVLNNSDKLHFLFDPSIFFRTSLRAKEARALGKRLRKFVSVDPQLLVSVKVTINHVCYAQKWYFCDFGDLTLTLARS